MAQTTPIPVPLKEAIEKVSIKTGLPISVVKSLLNCGWTYIEQINEPPRWVKRDLPAMLILTDD